MVDTAPTRVPGVRPPPASRVDDARSGRTRPAPDRSPRPPVVARRHRAWLAFLRRPAWQQVLVLYLVSRLLAGAVIEAAAVLVQNPAGVHDLHPDYLDLVRIWDGEWYQRIAEHGYPPSLPHAEQGNVDYNAWAFFPVFPMLVRALMWTGLPFSAAASVLNLVGGAVAALLVHRLFAARPGPGSDHERGRLALLATGLWCVLPSAPVLQVAYSEALAALLLAAVLLLLLRRHYLLCVPVVLLLGLTRAIAAPVAVVVLWHAVHRWRQRRQDPWSVRSRLSVLLLGAATGVSALLWPAIVAWRTGVPTAFFQTQAAWGQKPTDGPFVPWISWAWDRLGVVGVLLLVGVVVAGVQQLAGRHTAWLATELRVFGVAYPLYLLAVVRPITSMWRFLLLDLPIAAALASAAARGGLGRTLSPHWRWRVAGTAVVAVAAMAVWVGVLLTRIPWADSPP